jgi:hypothetical protein
MSSKKTTGWIEERWPVMDEPETLSEQVGALSVADECGDDEDRTLEILQQLENFFSTPEFTGSLQSFVQEHIEKFVFVDPGAEQPLRLLKLSKDVFALYSLV